MFKKKSYSSNLSERQKHRAHKYTHTVTERGTHTEKAIAFAGSLCNACKGRACNPLGGAGIQLVEPSPPTFCISKKLEAGAELGLEPRILI